MTTRRPSLTQFIITARERRDLEARFARDMAVLRQRLERPHPLETRDQFCERLMRQFFATLQRYEQLFTVGWRQPGRGGGRPAGLANEPKGAVGAPKRDDIDEWLVPLVDTWKVQAERHGDGNTSDQRAIVELLYRGAPPETRRELDRELEKAKRSADTKYAQKHALRKAILCVEGARFEWWVKRLDRARRTLRRRSRRQWRSA